MTQFSIQAIKGNGKANLSYGNSRDGKSITLTGTVYDCEFETKVRNGREVTKMDIGDKYYGVTLTVMIPKEQADEVIQEVQQFLDNNAELGVTDPKVGLVFECKSLGKPVEGRHPVYNTRSLNVIVQRPTFIAVEEPAEIFSDEDELDEITSQAAEIATDRSKQSLLDAVARRLNLVKESNDEEMEKARDAKQVTAKKKLKNKLPK